MPSGRRHWNAALVLLAACGGTSVCGEGLQSVEGKCVYSCDPPCSADQVCNATIESAECECIVAGYEGTPCAWGGGLQDPQFQNDERWTTGSVQLLSVAGPSGPGIASFESLVACKAGAVAQTVEMPGYEESEPFVIEVEYRYDDVGPVEVGYGRAFRRLSPDSPDPTVWQLDEFCLGEAGYGGPVKFQVTAGEPLPNCYLAPSGTIEVDRLEIRVANDGECARPGEVLNAEANVGAGGWTFHLPFAGVGDTEAAFREGVGKPGTDGSPTDGARLFKPAESTKGAGMYVQLNVPLASSLPSPAVRFWWRGTTGWPFYLDLGTYPGPFATTEPLDWLLGTGEPQTSVYCLPPRTHGNVVDLSFVVNGVASAVDVELVVDNVEIISDASCGDAENIFDPTFASAPSRWPGTNIIFGRPLGSDVNVIESAGRDDQNGALELRYGSSDADLEIHSWVWVPPTDDREGPALRFYSNVPAEPGIGVFWAFGTGGIETPCAGELCPIIPLSSALPLGLGWRPNLVCLPEEWAERWFRFRVALRRIEGPYQVFDPPRAVLLDEFEVVTDERCAR